MIISYTILQIFRVMRHEQGKCIKMYIPGCYFITLIGINKVNWGFSWQKILT
jgi:hypothetical protein